MSSKTKRIALLGAAAAIALAAEVGQAQTGGEGFGDFVWDDLNQNGIQDPGELGVPGVSVDLFRDDSGYTISIANDTTDANGIYFLNIGSGGSSFSYIVQFTLPAGFQFSPANQGVSDAADSDVTDFATGRTDVMQGASVLPFPSGPLLTVDASISLQPVPEPGTLAIVCLGLAGLAWRTRRRG